MMISTIPRVLIAGTASGCGKTTIVCGILAALRKNGQRPAAFKCGPDYIDPMFHAAVLGAECVNLDPFFSDENTLRYLMQKSFRGADIAVTEGVMGYYDGTGQSGSENSTYTVAVKTGSPVVLVVNGKGSSTSVLAVVKGFAEFAPDSRICGVIVNNVTEATYRQLKARLLRCFGGRITPVGYLPKLPKECLLESRHLGLITAAEVPNLAERLDRVADILSQTVDLDVLTALANTAKPLEYSPVAVERLKTVRIAVARDKAFCFYYRDNLDLLREMGAELEFFSPLADEPIPKGACGLLLGGGYPELYAERLSKNDVSRQSIRSAVEQGLPTIAECGGFIYLGQAVDGKSMCGALSHTSTNCARPVRFGYISLATLSDSIFGKKGTVLRGHEFHYFDSSFCGDDCAVKKTGGTLYRAAVLRDSLYAGYPHLYFYSNIKAAAAFYIKCIDWSGLV